MKKKQYFIIRTYTLLWLLCTVCLESKAMNARVYSSIITNHEIVSKLVKSTTFENLSMNIALTFLASSMHRELLSESQLKYEDELMKSYSTRLDLTFPEKLEIANIAGFASWEQYMEMMELIKGLRAKLYLEFPALRELAPAELQNVLKEAVTQIDVAKKLDTNPELRRCFKEAGDILNECVSKPGIYYSLARKLTGVCFATVLTIFVALLIEVELATAGAATIAALAEWNAEITLSTSLCTVIATTAFGFAVVKDIQKIKSCREEYNAKTASCVTTYKK